MSGLNRAIALFFVFLVVIRGIVAAKLSLFGDEAFYYLCSTHPDIAYVDHPFMTAMMVRFGVALFGPTTFGVRFLFLVCGFLFPIAIYRLARPIVGRDDAWLAAGCTLVIPAFAHLGVLAIPDVPLLLFAVIALHGFERGVATGRALPYLIGGIAVALGLSTHYRFGLVGLAFLLFSLLTREGRAQWKRPPFYLFGVVAAIGLLPVLLYNLRLDWAPLRFQGAERHGSGFDLNALLLHIPLQMVAVTPVLYVMFAALFIGWLRRWRRREVTAPIPLFALFASTHLLLFLVTSPIVDSSHATIHWPAAGYIPLVVYFPGWLRSFLHSPSPLRRRLGIAAPGIGAIVLSLALVELAFHPFRMQALERPFAGWNEVTAETIALLDRLDESAVVPIVIADHYMLGGHLALAVDRRADIYVLRHRKNVEHGRADQFRQWGLDEEGIARHPSEEALLVVERNRTRDRHWDEWSEHFSQLFDSIEKVGETRVTTNHDEDDDKIYFFYRGRIKK